MLEFLTTVVVVVVDIIDAFASVLVDIPLSLAFVVDADVVTFCAAAVGVVFVSAVPVFIIVAVVAVDVLSK